MDETTSEQLRHALDYSSRLKVGQSPPLRVVDKETYDVNFFGRKINPEARIKRFRQRLLEMAREAEKQWVEEGVAPFEQGSTLKG